MEHRLSAFYIIDAIIKSTLKAGDTEYPQLFNACIGNIVANAIVLPADKPKFDKLVELWTLNRLFDDKALSAASSRNASSPASSPRSNASSPAISPRGLATRDPRRNILAPAVGLNSTVGKNLAPGKLLNASSELQPVSTPAPAPLMMGTSAIQESLVNPQDNAENSVSQLLSKLRPLVAASVAPAAPNQVPDFNYAEEDKLDTVTALKAPPPSLPHRHQPAPPAFSPEDLMYVWLA